MTLNVMLLVLGSGPALTVNCWNSPGSIAALGLSAFQSMTLMTSVTGPAS